MYWMEDIDLDENEMINGDRQMECGWECAGYAVGTAECGRVALLFI